MRSRTPETVNPVELEDQLARTPWTQFLVWTGHMPGGRASSMCSRGLGVVTRVAEPVRLRQVLQQAATLDDGRGYPPEAVRLAARAHQRAKPAVYLLVEQAPSGEFVAVTDIPYPSGARRSIRQGDVVMTRNREPMFQPISADGSACPPTERC
jgi:hypothetical protein